MFKKMRLFSLVLGLIVVLFLSACNNNSVKFVIEFDSNGGSNVQNIDYDGESTITMPPNPTKEGFVFDGWYWDNGTFLVPFTANSLLDTPLEENISVYAKWDINRYTITFNSNGGSDITPITQEYNTIVTAPEYPTKTGYTFSGWYVDEALTTAYTITKMPIDGITLYAKWDINRYTITFNSNGGSDITPITQEYNTIVTAPEYPTKTGYTFSGWYVDEALTTAYTITKMPIDGITLYAKWVTHWNQLIEFSRTNGIARVNSSGLVYYTLVVNENISINVFENQTVVLRFVVSNAWDLQIQYNYGMVDTGEKQIYYYSYIYEGYGFSDIVSFNGESNKFSVLIWNETSFDGTSLYWGFVNSFDEISFFLSSSTIKYFNNSNLIFK